MRMMKTLGRAALGLVAAILMSVAPVHAADTVVVGTVGSPSANLWPLFIGIEKGFFTAENVKVDLIYIPASANAIQQLAAGSLDMSFSTGLVDPIRAAEQGAALGIARFEIQAPPYALIAKSSIKSLKDLKGKVISVGGPKDITRIYVDRMLAPNGLKTGDYDYVYAGATTARAQALLSGAVDAAILLPPSNFQLQNQGFNDLGLTIEYAPELAFSGTMANKGWAARNRAEAVALLVRISGQKADDVEKAYDFFHKNNFFDRTGKISRVKLNALIDALVGLGDLPARGDVERFLLPGVARLSDWPGPAGVREVIAAPLAGLDLRQHYGHHQSPAVRAGGLIFCSGMLPVDPQTGERRHGTLTSEAHVILGNLKLLLESAGSSLDRLVQVHALIYDSIEYDVLNRVYRQYVANGPPARTVWTAQIEAGFKIQLDATAAA